MNLLTPFIDRGTVLFDGSTGTELQRRGLPIGTPPCLWNLEHPEKIRELHAAYIEAGSQVIETNTFTANPLQLRREHAEDSTEAVNRHGAELALSAAGGTRLVAASVGPLGSMIEPYGEVKRQEATDAFEQQLHVLYATGIRLILLETMISLEEALLALRVAKRLPDATVGVTMTFQDGSMTPFGESPEATARALADEGADFIGANCGNGFQEMSDLARRFRDATTLPLLIQPNAGMPELQGTTIIYPGTSAEFAGFVREMISLGIECVGGCCGTTPAHIREANTIVGELKNREQSSHQPRRNA